MQTEKTAGTAIRMGKFLRDYREAAGMSPEDVASLLDIDLEEYEEYERDERTPDITTIVKLNHIFALAADPWAEK